MSRFDVESSAGKRRPRGTVGESMRSRESGIHFASMVGRSTDVPNKVGLSAKALFSFYRCPTSQYHCNSAGSSRHWLPQDPLQLTGRHSNVGSIDALPQLTLFGTSPICINHNVLYHQAPHLSHL